VTGDKDVQMQLNAVDRQLAAIEETARDLHKAVDVGIDVAEVALIGRQLDAKLRDWVRGSTFLGNGELARSFATCNGVGFSLAGHAEASVGFNAMSNRASWKARWDNVWSEWLRALAWRDQVLEAAGLTLEHRRDGGLAAEWLTEGA